MFLTLGVFVLLKVPVTRAQGDSSAPPPQQGQEQGQGQGRGGREGGRPLFGKITAVHDGSIEITGQDGQAVTVKLTAQTEFRKDREPAKVSDFKIGDMVMVRGDENADHTVTGKMIGGRTGGSYAGPGLGGRPNGGMMGSPGTLGKDYVAGEVKSIEMHHESVTEAEPGDNVGFNVRGIDKNDIRRGEVAGPANNPPTVVESFTANIQVLNHPSVITAGYTPVFHLHTAQVAAEFTELLKRLDPKTGQTAEENPQTLKTGDAAVVRITPKRPLVIEKYKEFPQLGRFAVRDMGQTVAAGVVIDLKKREA